MSPPKARIEAALELLGSEHEPPPGWEARVLAAVRAPPVRSTRWTWWLTLPAVALVAIVIALWPRAPSGLALALEITPAGPIVRGNSAHVGDLVTATASGGERDRAIWVYRDDQLIAVCPGSSLCEISGDTARATIALGAEGLYAFVALSSALPLPHAQGSYDLDLVTAADAGAMSKVKRVVAR